jgi:hypothetical protein
MTIRDLLVHIDQTQAAQVRLEAGLKLAERFGAHLTALYLAAEPFMRSAAGFHLPADVVREHLRHAEAEAEPVFAAAIRAAERRGVELETRLETGSLDRLPSILAINAHPPEKVKSAIAKAHRAKTRRLRGVFAL